MTSGNWRYALASVAGTLHARQEIGCQDASDCRVLRTGGEEVLVAVAADGAGSARRAGTGSRLACSLLLEAVTGRLEREGAVRGVTRAFAQDWVTRFQDEVAARAETEGGEPQEYACTVLAAVLGAEGAAFLQIGDGAIVVASDEDSDGFCWVFWPQQGEYENTTYFATDAAARERLEYDFIERRIDEVALFTDGLQRLALHFGSRTAHAPFFAPMFAPVRAAPEGFSEDLSAALAAYLDLPAVNARTDDDKTLILATRRARRVDG